MTISHIMSSTEYLSPTCGITMLALHLRFDENVAALTGFLFYFFIYLYTYTYTSVCDDIVAETAYTAMCVALFAVG